MSLDIILPFLRPIEHLIQDADITKIMVNGWRRIFVEQQGRVREVTDVRLDERNLRVAVKNIARALGDDVSEEKPILDSRLPDGSRVVTVLPPCSLGGTTLTIRKFQTRFFTADELVRIGTMTPELLAIVRAAIARNENILISGATSTDKTTLLNALAAFLPLEDRVVLIEDTAELQIERPNLVRFEARREHTNRPAVTIRELLRATLRHRPDRIIVGDVRGGEAFDLLQALNTGHAGSLSTVHANSAEQALARLASCVVQSGVELPYQAVRFQIGDSIDLVIHLVRRRGARVVEELIRIGRYDAERDRYETSALHESREDSCTRFALLPTSPESQSLVGPGRSDDSSLRPADGRGADFFAEWRDYLAPLLLDGAAEYPETMIPALANLAGDEQSGIVAAGVEPPVFINRYQIDRAKFEAFLGDRLEEGLRLLANSAGSNPYATRAQEDAALWFAERRGERRIIAPDQSRRDD